MPTSNATGSATNHEEPPRPGVLKTITVEDFANPEAKAADVFRVITAAYTNSDRGLRDRPVTIKIVRRKYQDDSVEDIKEKAIDRFLSSIYGKCSALFSVGAPEYRHCKDIMEADEGGSYFLVHLTTFKPLPSFIDNINAMTSGEETNNSNLSAASCELDPQSVVLDALRRCGVVPMGEQLRILKSVSGRLEKVVVTQSEDERKANFRGRRHGHVATGMDMMVAGEFVEDTEGVVFDIDKKIEDILSKNPPSLWNERDKSFSDAYRFFQQNYGKYVERGLFYQHHLGKIDAPLKRALVDYCYRMRKSLADILPPKCVKTDREIKAYQEARRPLPSRLRHATLRRRARALAAPG